MRGCTVALSALGVALLLPASSAWADFAFLCNGIDANGNPSGDGCGSCSAQTAARWEIGTVPWHYDKTTLPPGVEGVSASRWAAEIAQARAGWNAVMGLSLVDGGDVGDAGGNFRSFADDDGENQIFWITSPFEFENQIGVSAAAGILGVTVAQNERCFGGRAIFDSDVVMNGVSPDDGGFDWRFSSSVSTLAHEMGHGLGLGHACVFCSDLMSATAGNGDPEGPQAGDIQGIQLLYPAPGLVGSACDNDFDCNDDLCASVGDTSFCSESCAGGAACPNGMICFDDATQGEICIFSSTEVAEVGDACNPPGCVDACDISNIGPGCNLCVPFQDGTSTCLAGCNVQTGQGCGDNEECAQVFQNDDVSGVCVPQGVVGDGARGDTCSAQDGCQVGLTCVVFQGDDSGFCRADCDNDTAAGCLATENCFAVFADGSAVCFPVGPGEEGDSCNVNDLSACAHGLVCLDDAKCRQRCDQGFTCAGAEQECVATAALSFCNPVLPGAEGEGEGEGEGEPGVGCRIARGNFDCPVGSACEVDDGAAVGTCTGDEGDAEAFFLCEEDDDCDTGLCQLGVCTRPCDQGGCPDGYDCDDDLAPAADADGEPGLCVPESCNNNYELCDADAGFFCVYNETEHYTCAKDGDPLGCTCSSTHGSRPGPLVGLLALSCVAWLGRGQRRRKTV